jgi:hypothetical protein
MERAATVIIPFLVQLHLLVAGVAAHLAMQIQMGQMGAVAAAAAQIAPAHLLLDQLALERLVKVTTVEYGLRAPWPPAGVVALVQ